MEPERYVLVFVKDTHRHIFIYDDESNEKLIHHLRNLAADPNVSVSWFDAAILTEKIRLQISQPSISYDPVTLLE